MSSKKLILVIGATGTQGIAVVDSLLSPKEDGSPSPYAVRALTRDPTSRRAKMLEAKGVELVQGTFEDFPSVFAALQGVYGAFVNTDSFTVGEQREIYDGIRIFELAKQVGTVRHYVWSSLDYGLKKGNYNPVYNADHYDAKARVTDWMKAQASIVSDDDMSWSVLCTGPYIEMLNNVMFGPLGKRADGTFVFASPIGKGHVPMISVLDIGWWTRYIFDHRAETSAKELEIASDWVGWEYLVETFTKVTGQKAVWLDQTIEEWFDNFTNADKPVAVDNTAKGYKTFRKNFTGWWAMFRDEIIQRDMEWIRKIHPGTRDLESWMRETGYNGTLDKGLLKLDEDGNSIGSGMNLEKIRKL